MCIAFRDLPLALPIRTVAGPAGLQVLDFTLMLAKATEKRRGGDHQTRIPYRLKEWTFDSNFRPLSHDECIHLAPPQAAQRGELDDYGSHRLVFLPSTLIWGSGGASRCWHDGAVFAAFCLDCEGVDLDVVSVPDFWQGIGLGGLMTPTLLDGSPLLQPPVSDHLFVGRVPVDRLPVTEANGR